MLKRSFFAVLGLAISFVSFASTDTDTVAGLKGDMRIPGYTKQQLHHLAKKHPKSTEKKENFTVISYNYDKVTEEARHSVQQIINHLNRIRAKTRNRATRMHAELLYLAHSPLIANVPYSLDGAEGEGTWCTGIAPQAARCQHIQQDPIYRLDQFDCATLLSTVLGLLHADSLKQFNRAILRIEYGAAGNKVKTISYYNRNNFISASFNPVNQARHVLKDVTPLGALAPYAKKISAIVNIERWLHFKQRPHQLKENVRVLKESSGPLMVERFTNNYPPQHPNLLARRVSITYISKYDLTKKHLGADNKISYQPNFAFIQKIPTPAAMNIVRTDKKWIVHGQPINQLIGSGLLVSHVGLLYRNQFKKGQTIYRQILCHYASGKKVCRVKPYICHQKMCHRVMFLEATDAYPNGYYWYQENGKYHCTANKPRQGIPYTMCNRVISIPLGRYFTQYEYGRFLYMEMPSILGIHIEKIITTRS